MENLRRANRQRFPLNPPVFYLLAENICPKLWLVSPSRLLQLAPCELPRHTPRAPALSAPSLTTRSQAFFAQGAAGQEEGRCAGEGEEGEEELGELIEHRRRGLRSARPTPVPPAGLVHWEGGTGQRRRTDGRACATHSLTALRWHRQLPYLFSPQAEGVPRACWRAGRR